MQHAVQKIGLNLGASRLPTDGYCSRHWMKHAVGFCDVNPQPQPTYSSS